MGKDWYCDGLEPTITARRYDAQVCKRKFVTLSLGFFVCEHSYHSVYLCVEIEAAKRKAVIKQNATKKKEVGGQVYAVTGSSESSTKRKLLEKQGRLPKKPKTVLEPVMGLEAEGRKTITPTKHGAGKGLMKGSSTTQEKSSVLFRKDSKYTLEKLSSILTSEDYEDLSNHATEAMGESGLFCVAQVRRVRPCPFYPVHLPPSLTIFIFRQW